MAITSEITTRIATSDLPAGFTNPETTITFTSPLKQKFTYTVAITGLSHSSEADTGLDQLLADIKDWIDAAYLLSTLHLDPTDTVDVIIYVDKIERQNSQSSIYITGEEQFVVTGQVFWE